MLAFLLLAHLARAATCNPTTAADLQAPVTDGESGVIQLEEDPVRTAVTKADETLRCLTELLAPADVAAIHRLHAYGAFVAGDTAATRRAFGAARAADPAWIITDRLAPPGTPLRNLFNTSSLDVATETVKLPTGTLLYVDGIKSSERPQDRPALLQLTSLSGRVLATVWLTEDQPLPDWSAFASAVPVAIVALPKPPPSRVQKERNALPWWISAGGAVLAGGGVYAWALADHAHYVDTTTGMDEAQLAALRQSANTKVVISGGLGAVGIGLGVVALRW